MATATTLADLDADSKEISRALSQLFRMTTRIKAQLSSERSGWSTFPLLARLCEDGPLRQSDLAERVHSDVSTVSRQVAHLVESGLVERTPDPADGRAARLAITAGGRISHGKHLQMRDEYLTGVLTDWPERDRRRFAHLLQRFVDDIERCAPTTVTMKRSEHA
ncbi:MAG: MarR family winged helix-turn-helix transcriptional regulator [Mycobacteriales bacterium]